MNMKISAGRKSIPAVVVGLDCITGLQTTRILARHGVPVIGVAEDPHSFACKTRHCQQQVITSTRSEALIEALERLAQQQTTRPVLFPCTDTSVLLISRFRDRLQAHYRIALPSEEIVEMLLDKKAFCEFARDHELPIPRTFFLRSRDDAERAAKQIQYPCILKPPLKTPKWERSTKIKAFKPASAEELLEIYDRCAPWAEVLMLQEWIAGTDAELYSCNCYFDRQGQPQAVFTARKLRQWPPETGTSCLGEECRNDELREVALRLFRLVDFRGLGYLEMKRDVRTGRQLIIEPNIGRPTGRSAIAEAGGVELLYTMYCDLAGLPSPNAGTQTYRGAKWIYWRQDLRSAFHYWKRGELTLGEWMRTLAGRKACAVFSWYDPLPFFADWLGTAAKFSRRRQLGPPSRGSGAEPARREESHTAASAAREVAVAERTAAAGAAAASSAQSSSLEPPGAR